MKKDKPYYKKKLKNLFSLYVRQRANNQCEAKELGQCFGRLHCSHIKTIGAYPNLQFDLLNAISLCHKHHIGWAHNNVKEFEDWFKHKYPARWVYLQRNKNIMFHPTLNGLKELHDFYKKKVKKDKVSELLFKY